MNTLKDNNKLGCIVEGDKEGEDENAKKGQYILNIINKEIEQIELALTVSNVRKLY